MLKGFKNSRCNYEYYIRNYCCMHSLSLVTRVIILYIWFFSINYMLFHIK